MDEKNVIGYLNDEVKDTCGKVKEYFALQGRCGNDAPGYFIQTLGCQQNEADSERCGGLARMMGYQRVDNPENAELILVNTCAIREHAETRALSFIGEYRHIKDSNKNCIIGVCGCMVSQKSRAEQIKASYPYVSFTFDTNAIYSLPSLVLNKLNNGKRKFVCDTKDNITEGIPTDRVSRHMVWLSIMYGCNNFCTYCIVPYVRGRERSRKPEDIIAEAKLLIADGAKDITLLGQNVNSYDGGCDIADLMHRICEIDGDFTLHFMTSHPKDASQKLFDCIASEPKIAKHFHLPLQSGSDRILKRMNRVYTSSSYYEKVLALKETVPDISITTDVIVGFPGETDEDYQMTIEMLKKVQYDMAFAFVFSPREGTPASRMTDTVPHNVATDRLAYLQKMQDEISVSRLSRFMDKDIRVLVEGTSKTDPNVLTGRGEPVRPVHFAGDKSLIGQFVNVHVTGQEVYNLDAVLNK